MMIILCVTCAYSSTIVVNLGYVTIVMSIRMLMLGLCVGSAINELLMNDDPYLCTPV